MDEMNLLARLRDEVPVSAPSAHARDVLFDAMADDAATRGLAALGSAGRRAGATRWAPPHRAGRAWRLAIASGLGLAVTAAATAGVFGAYTFPPGSAPAGGGHGQVVELAYQAAAAAAARPGARPGQWVYWQEKQVGSIPAGVFQVWTTADSRRAAYVENGKVTFLPCPAHAAGSADGVSGAATCAFDGPPAVFQGSGGKRVSSVSGPTAPLSYRDLASLPGSPRELVRHLEHIRLRGWGPPPYRAFRLIGFLLASYAMPSAQTAELYRALADIPGVQVKDHSVDVAGRTGAAFQLPVSPGWKVAQEIVIDPESHAFMGYELLGPAGRISGTAVLRQALVGGPGQLP